MCFKTLRGSPEGKVQRGQYLLVVGLGRYISSGVMSSNFFIVNIIKLKFSCGFGAAEEAFELSRRKERKNRVKVLF